MRVLAMVSFSRLVFEIASGVKGAWPESTHRQRRQRINIGHDINEHRPLRLERARERAREIAGLLDANSDRAHVFGEPCEIHLVERPEFVRLFGLLAAIDA